MPAVLDITPAPLHELKPYKSLDNEELAARIEAVRARAGAAAADPGASLPAGRSDRPWPTCAATATSSARWRPRAATAGTIVFCGVHFMAETADILANRPEKLAERGGERVHGHPARHGRRLLDGRHGRRSSRSKTAWDELGEVIDTERHHAGHVHQLGRQPEGVLRPARRHRLHVEQRRGGARVGVRADAAACCSSPISTWAATRRSAMGIPLDADAGLGSVRRRARRQHARSRSSSSQRDPLEGALQRPSDVPRRARRSCSAQKHPGHQDPRASRVPAGSGRHGRRIAARRARSSRRSKRPRRARSGRSAPSCTWSTA